MIMTFGKYKGQEVREIPLAYCQWLVNNVDLRGELGEEINNRLGVDTDHLLELKHQVGHYKRELERWQIQYAELAEKYHSLQARMTYTDTICLK